jgi:L-malate glycosyltransferase
MKIAYLLESVVLCGGVKVVLCQAEALLKRGHHVVVISPDPYPQWFEGDILYKRADPMQPIGLEVFDHIIGTTSGIILSLYDSGSLRRRLRHLIQGVERELEETRTFRDMIDDAHSLPVLKMTVSENLAERLGLIYPGHGFLSVGQGIQEKYFFPPRKEWEYDGTMIDRVFLIGPLNISVKQIPIGLQVFREVKKKHKSLTLVRVSSVDTQNHEVPYTGDMTVYHVGLTPRRVGDVLRTGSGILISPSGPEEGFGLPGIEAMACGVPAVLSDIPSHRSFDDPDDYAVFAPHNDIGAMARAVGFLVGDVSERKRLVRRGLEVAALYSFGRVAEHIENILFHG